MLLTIKEFLRKRTATAKNGALYLRFTYDRQHIYYNLGEAIPTSNFDSKRGLVIKHDNAEALNDLIIIEKSALHKKIIDL